MSEHNKPQMPGVVEALRNHRLPHDQPSQLADAFRFGWRSAVQAMEDENEALKTLLVKCNESRDRLVGELAAAGKWHSLMQRAGHALGLMAGTDLLTELIPAIERLAAAKQGEAVPREPTALEDRVLGKAAMRSGKVVTHPAPVQEGWKLVPVKMTKQMFDAFQCAASTHRVSDDKGTWHEYAWSAALAAAPSTGEPK